MVVVATVSYLADPQDPSKKYASTHFDMFRIQRMARSPSTGTICPRTRRCSTPIPTSPTSLDARLAATPSQDRWRAIVNRLGPQILGAICLLLAAQAHAADAHWAASWGASPQGAHGGAGASSRGRRTFHDQTIRQVIRLSGGGQGPASASPTNSGPGPVTIGAAHIALAGSGGAIQPAGDHVLTFDGKPSAVIRAGATLLERPALSLLSRRCRSSRSASTCRIRSTPAPATARAWRRPLSCPRRHADRRGLRRRARRR